MQQSIMGQVQNSNDIIRHQRHCTRDTGVLVQNQGPRVQMMGDFRCAGSQRFGAVHVAARQCGGGTLHHGLL